MTETKPPHTVKPHTPGWNPSAIGIAMAIAGMPPSAVRHLARQGRPKDNPPEIDTVIDAVVAQAVLDARIGKAEAKRKRKSAKRLGKRPAARRAE